MAASPVSPIRVLHVDDETNQLRITKSFLEIFEPSMVIESTTSNEQALAMLAEGAFDCVVSDYQMPRMSGIELALRVLEVLSIKSAHDVALQAAFHSVPEQIHPTSEPAAPHERDPVPSPLPAGLALIRECVVGLACHGLLLPRVYSP